MSRHRVLVLGGGTAGMTAAWQLSCTAERRAAFDVTVASMGWRLGGKGATGRSARHGARVHEHGLHIWMGFYHHAFRVVAAVYEAARTPGGATIDSAFLPLHDVALADASGHVLHLSAPPLPGRPWHDDRPVGPWLHELAAWAEGHALPAARASAAEPARAISHLGDLGRFAATVAVGLAREGRDPWQRLDDEDLRAWLRRHGATDPRVHDCSAVRAFYNLAFAYPDGQSGFGRGAVAAGAALRSLLRMGFTYRGAPFWKMAAGMGDTVFAPMYDALTARGVRFDFFRRVDGIDVRGGRVERVKLGVQASLAGNLYEPLMTVKGRRCWPDAPLGAQLAAVMDGDLESQHGAPLRTETRRRGADFDAVVLAIPVPVHDRIAGAVRRSNPAFDAMVRNHASVVTTAAQVWSRDPLPALGWAGAPPIAVNGNHPLSSWADMTEVAAAEAWSVPPAALLYFVDVAPGERFHGMTRTEAARAVRDRLKPWLADPAAFPVLGRLCHGLLRDGEDALDAQYFRANVDPAERYVLSLPGSTRHRLGADSGTDGLFLAGDWTRTSINGGSVEAAAESGRLAGEAVAARFGHGTGRLADAPV